MVCAALFDIIIIMPHPSKGTPGKKGGKQFRINSADYDYKSAKRAGIKPDSTGHWPSRDPKTGLILKGTRHPTYHKTVEGEAKAGMEIYKGRNGRMYSRPKK